MDKRRLSKMDIINATFPKQEYGYWIGLLISDEFDSKLRYMNVALMEEVIKETKKMEQRMDNMDHHIKNLILEKEELLTNNKELKNEMENFI